MLLLPLIALNAAVLDEPDWREFDRRPRGWGETPTFYDAARIERREARVRMWIRYRIMLSGLPDPRIEARIEIDCAGQRSRTLESITSDGAGSFAGPLRQRFHRRLRPIAAGSVEAALARRVCAQG